ncbi:hypothetical protein J31TS4_18470 [Paenibacillus sp. J31TS4]|nr:hypothetical protein [Paenibacillus sp. J31TS4]GIP38567.1 hypothetical protein J31TS4_18470 [Paenibacillus sp. J31TS4]
MTFTSIDDIIDYYTNEHAKQPEPAQQAEENNSEPSGQEAPVVH